MKGLLLKDLYNMKVFSKTLFALVAMMAVFGVMMNNPSYICAMTIVMSLSVSMNGIALDEKAHWDQYAMTFPVTRRMLVLEKMILMVSITLAGGVLAIVLGGTMTVVTGGNLPLLLLGCVTGMGVVMIMQSVLMPILLKLGTENARFAMIAVLAAPAVLIVLVVRSGKIPMEVLEENVYFWIRMGSGLMVLAGIVALFVSYWISVRIYEKKEW